MPTTSSDAKRQMGFEEAIHFLKEGCMMTRAAWHKEDIPNYPEVWLYEGTFYISDDPQNKRLPYGFRQEDLLAEDWIIV